MSATKTTIATPGFLRRLAAICYDSLLLGSVLFFAGVPLVFIPAALRADPAVRAAIQLYLLAVCFAFFGGFWVHGGQTLGMRAWRLKVVAANGGALTWRLALRRFALALVSWACLGLGFLWILWDPERRAWHDHWSRTRLVLVPKPPAARPRAAT